MLKKLVIISLLPFSGLAACDDAAQCTGHICGGDVLLTDNEGGGIALEYIYLDQDLRNADPSQPPLPATILRLTAFFVNHQVPEINPIPVGNECTNLDATKSWPIYSGLPKEELDVGTVTLKGKNLAGTDTTIPLDKKTNDDDPFNRPHQTHYDKILLEADKLAAPNSSFTVEISGSDKVAAATLPDAIFLANEFTVREPGLDDNPVFRAGEDFTVHWNPVQSTNLPAGDLVAGIVWLVDRTNKPTHMCPTLHAAGQFTIPGAAIREHMEVALARGAGDPPDTMGGPMKPPSSMILLRNAVVHRLARLPNNDENNIRRVDMLSLFCWAQLVPLAP